METLERLQNEIGELYDFDRDRRAEISCVREGNARLEEKVIAIRDKIDTAFEEQERQQISFVTSVNKQFLEMNKAIENMPNLIAARVAVKTKWRPSHTVALITTLCGSGGIITVLILFLIGG